MIARPFIGTPGSFTRTARRHDYSLHLPAQRCWISFLLRGEVIAVGKINDIFVGQELRE